MMMFFLCFFRVRVLAENSPNATGLQNLEAVVVVGEVATSSTTSSAADAAAAPATDESATTQQQQQQQQENALPVEATTASDAAVIETTSLMNENFEELLSSGASRRPIASTHRLIVPLSHNEWVLFLSFVLCFFSYFLCRDSFFVSLYFLVIVSSTVFFRPRLT